MASGDQYGPVLPPGMVVASETASRSTGGGSSKKCKRKVLGPHLPSRMQKSSDSDGDDLSDEGQLTVKMESELSPEYSIQDDDEEEEDEEEEDEDEKSQNGRAVGPMPSEMSQGGDDVVHATEEFERRSKRMKDKLTVKAEAEEGPSKREEWMTELPPEMGKSFGLQSRTFSKGGNHSGDSKDRSSWTDTPSVKKEKDSSKGKKRKRDDEKMVSAREDQMHQQVEEYNKSKRPESLMDLHSKKLKKKKKKEKKEKKKRKERGEKEDKVERRPFDREKDMHVNAFDDAQRKSIIKKSQLLNTRFSHGGTTSHFL